MDAANVDRIARLFGGASTRRAGMRALIGAALGLTAPDAAARPLDEGICSDYQENQGCDTDADCCRQGVCKTTGVKAPKGYAGRCRCARFGKPCGRDSQCCARRGQQMSCLSGRCGYACAAVGAACSAKVACCGDAASVACTNGVCTEIQQCVALAGVCTPGVDSCCTGSCDNVASPENANRCCLPEGSACTDRTECCCTGVAAAYSNCIDQGNGLVCLCGD